jgi:hypothetical protein
MPAKHNLFDAWPTPIGSGDAADSSPIAAEIYPSPSQGPLVFATAASATELYAPGTNLATEINAGQLYQGQIGDCFLISSIGEIAITDPADIKSMIQQNANGTETVRLYEPSMSRASVAFQPEAVTVSNAFPSYSVDSGAGQDVVSGVKVIWPQVLEKAVATLDGGYAAIANGGSPVVAMEQLTGKAAVGYAPGKLSVTALESDITAKDLIVMDTANSASLPDGLVGDHAYMFGSLSASGSVQLLNPWGFDQPAAIPITRLAAAGIVEIDVGAHV